jgi:tripartite-type tricarboxylate transporter receptor subunit TctC
MRRKVLLMVTGAATLFVTGLPVYAQSDYPTKPIKLVVAFAAGGATDIVGRLMAHGMEKELGQPIIVENKPGGGSNIGSEVVARAKPDGYTLLLGTIANATNMSIYNNMRYDTEKDFVPITHFMSSPSVLVVNSALPIHNVKELLDYARANPGKLSFASSGAGGSPHHAGRRSQGHASGPAGSGVRDRVQALLSGWPHRRPGDGRHRSRQ